MATLKEIYEEINEEVSEDLTISATSESKVAEHRLWMYLFTEVSNILQGIWEVFRQQLVDAAAEVPTGNDAWWDRELRKFQYGDSLVIDNLTKKYYYETIDTDKQIVSRVAIFGNTIKVAKGDGSPEALSTDEYDALDSYIRKLQPTGSNLILVSQASDLVLIACEIYYDAIISLSVVQENVEAAINAYLETLEFGVGSTGTFYISRVVDAIQEVEGVVDVEVQQVSAKQDGGQMGTVERRYFPVSGYISIDPDYPLSTSLTFTPEI